MARLEREARLKRITQFFIYFLVIVVFIMLIISFVLIRRWEKIEKEKQKEKPSTAYVMKDVGIQR